MKNGKDVEHGARYVSDVFFVLGLESGRAYFLYLARLFRISLQSYAVSFCRSLTGVLAPEKTSCTVDTVDKVVSGSESTSLRNLIMADQHEHDQISPVSPMDAPSMGFPPVQQRSHVVDQWRVRPSIDSTLSKDKQSWATPPLPPIPNEKRPEAWRRRSLKRCSYASQMSNYSTVDSPADPESKHRRKVSLVSLDPSMKSNASRNFSRPTRYRQDGARSVDLNWKLAGFNPQNWSKAKKWVHTIAAGTVAFTCAFASSIITPANTIVNDTGQSIAIIPVLPLALFAAGLAFGPTLNSLCSELIGRKLVSIISMATFALVTLGSAFVDSFYPFIACRVAGAILASPALDASSIMLFDLWSATTRQIPLAIYSLTLLLGLAVGAVAAPFMLYFKDRSWASYITLFVFIPCIALLVCTRETHRNTIRRRTSSGAICGKLTKGKMKALGKPFHLVFARPRILMCTILASCNFATFYAILSVFPQILAEASRRTLKSQGSSFLGMVVGVAVGFMVLVVIHFWMEYMTINGLRRKGLVQSEKDKTASSHVRMDSRTSTTPFRHTSSAVSPLGQSRNASRSSLPQLKTAVDAQIRDLNKNMDIAVAVTNYLKGLPENAGKRIAPERILHVLEQSLTFCDVCLLLEGYDLTFDRATLAGVLADTLPTGLTDVAFMKMPAPPPPVASSPLASPSPEDQVWPFSLDSPQVAAHSRTSRMSRKETRVQRRGRSSTQPQLYISLFGSLFSTGGLFMFGWTVSPKASSIVPVVAMGIFACGGILVFISSTDYLFTISGSTTNGEYAVAATSSFRWLFAAAFAIFAVPLFGAVDTAWATSVLGFINAAGSLMALILLVVSMLSKDSPKRQRAA